MMDTLRLSIRHATRYEYTPAAKGVVMRLRLYPSRFQTQVVESWTVSVGEDAVPAQRMDGACVEEAVWSHEGEIFTLDVVAEGVVRRAEDQGIVKGLKERTPPALFLRGTSLTAPDAAIEDLAATGRRADRLETLHALSALVRDAVDYVSGSTDMATSASAALRQAKGVCQDHAHVFIAAARVLDIPARYVAGYYLAGEDGGLTRTHGWAEGHVEGLGWVGFDIANRTCPTPEHVRVACQLDAGGAALVSGAVSGNTQETLTASVAMSQTQQ
jgi:transglutaminase-like putative cysteine protease